MKIFEMWVLNLFLGTMGEQSDAFNKNSPLETQTSGYIV